MLHFLGREGSSEALWRVRHHGRLPGHEGQGVRQVEGVRLRHLQLLVHGRGGAREGQARHQREGGQHQEGRVRVQQVQDFEL